MKDATQFRERFKRWKSGELVYDKGRPIDPPEYSVGSLVSGIYANNPREEYLGEPSHHYDFTQSEEWADAHGYYPDARGHRDDRVKKPAHPSHPSRGTWSGDKFELTDLGIQNPNYTLFGLNDGGQDPQAILTYKGSIVLPEITVTPKGNYIRNPYDNINIHLPKYADGKDDDPIIPAGMLKEVVVTAPRRYFKEYDNNGNPVYTSNYRESLSYLNSFLPKGDIEKRRERWYALNVGSNGQVRPGLKGYAKDIADITAIGLGGALAPLFFAPIAAGATPAAQALVTPGSAFWTNPLTRQIVTGTTASTAVDAGSKAITGNTWGENIAGGIKDVTGWDPRNSIYTSWIPDATNPGWFMNPTRVLNTVNSTVQGTKKGILFLNSPITGEWTQFGNRKYRFKPGYFGMNGTPVESRAIAMTDAELDAAYKAAVESGNRIEALRLLEQAYLNSGIPKSEITMTPEGNALGWFHGAEWGNHTIFDSSAMNATIGGTSAAGRVKGNFLTTDLPSAARYAGRSSRYSSMPDPKETSPSTFLEKLQNLFGKYKPRTFYPAERVGDMAPRAERLFDTKGQPPISHISKVDRVVYPMYVNPGNNPMILDFEGRPWSNSPVEFPNNFYLKKWIRDDVAKTYKEEIVPFESKEEAMAAWKADPINIRRGNTDLEKEYFDDGVRYIEGFNSAPRYERVKLVEERVPNTTNGAVQTAAKKGNSSVLIRNVIDSNGGPNGVHYAIDDLVTLKPEQMKLADITYDDAGNLIPLSQRFLWGNKDSRYGLIPWILGGGTATTLYNNLNRYKNGKDSIRIKPNRRGTFTKAAKAHGMNVQGFASKVLANKDNYSSAMVKKANFARNARKFKH